MTSEMTERPELDAATSINFSLTHPLDAGQYPAWLKRQPHSELHLPGIGGRRSNQPRLRSVNVGIRIGKIGVICEVEEFPSHLKLETLRKREVLHHCRI